VSSQPFAPCEAVQLFARIEDLPPFRQDAFWSLHQARGSRFLNFLEIGIVSEKWSFFSPGKTFWFFLSGLPNYNSRSTPICHPPIWCSLIEGLISPPPWRFLLHFLVFFLNKGCPRPPPKTFIFLFSIFQFYRFPMLPTFLPLPTYKRVINLPASTLRGLFPSLYYLIFLLFLS